MICFRIIFQTVFYGFRGCPGSRNHGFRMGRVAKITILLAFTFSPFRHPFGSPFAPQNALKISFWFTLGALGSEFSSSVASTFSQCFLKACPGLHFHEKTSKREGDIALNSFHLPPSHTLPPCSAKDRTAGAFRNICIHMCVWICRCK